jgi:phosphoglycolate phosphatase
MDRRLYDLILWDWNGTLLRDGPFSVGIINAMLRARGKAELDHDEHARLFDFPVRRYYERLGFDFEAEPFEVVSQQFVDQYVAGVTASCGLRPQALETLKCLRDYGYRQSVLSASRQDYLEAFIGHFGLEGYFEELLGIDSVHAPGKLSRGKEWLERSGEDVERTLLIGDTVHDAEVAAELGVDCWLLEGGHHGRDRLEATGCVCLRDLSAVREALNPLGEVMRK